MILFPAIDIKEGKVVRLKQGRFDQMKEYADDPLMMARHWQNLGAQWLHVVDLDGAQKGKITNTTVIRKMAQSVEIPIQMGGGIRTQDDIQKLLDDGIGRVILGTKVVEDRKFIEKVISKWQEKIAVSLDCEHGLLTKKGWTDISDQKATDVVKELEALGLSCLIYTDIKQDGMLKGPNFQAIKEILQTTTIPVIASGGIAHLEDIRKLIALKPLGLLGAITGKAIYEGTLDFKDGLQLCLQNV